MGRAFSHWQRGGNQVREHEAPVCRWGMQLGIPGPERGARREDASHAPAACPPGRTRTAAGRRPGTSRGGSSRKLAALSSRERQNTTISDLQGLDNPGGGQDGVLGNHGEQAEDRLCYFKSNAGAGLTIFFEKRSRVSFSDIAADAGRGIPAQQAHTYEELIAESNKILLAVVSRDRAVIDLLRMSQGDKHAMECG